MVKNAYIHIPFCKSKCKYCSFISFPKLEQKEEYLKALIKEISYFYENEKLNTLYFGGGTPSLLQPFEFESLIKIFNTGSQTEITAELNPETLNYDYLRALNDCGINRISIGCQTFNDNILKLIGRRHNAEQVKNAVQNAQNAGFKNISLDFIYGLPEQNYDEFISDLKNAVSLCVQHISLYGLKIDEGCYFYSHKPQNIADDDTQADMYLGAIQTLTDAGFEHYEISNFSKSGFYSRHNLNYWDNNSYYGFGTSAHGYKDSIRYSNSASLEDYIINPYKHDKETVLSKAEKLEEEIFLGFRKMAGINKYLINEKYNIDFEKKYSGILNKYLSSGHIVQTNSGYKLSNNGILVSNIILSEFIEE